MIEFKRPLQSISLAKRKREKPGHHSSGIIPSMPLRDHFHPPVSERQPWEALHGAWPTIIVIDLNKRLSSRFVASPRVRLGTAFEIDVAAREAGEGDGTESQESGGTATATWAPPRPTLTVETHVPESDEYEVLIESAEQRLVAAIEIISPSNKDRPENRRAFVAKCAALIQRGVAVSIVDLVTTRHANLYLELLELLGQPDPAFGPDAGPLYAASCRWRQDRGKWKLESWAHPMQLQQPLPTLPIWLTETQAAPLDLEATYEETCRVLRIR
jgi:hypothetical protein